MKRLSWIFKLSNTFEQYRDHMNAPEQQAMFAQMGVKTFYIGVSKDDPKRATVMFQGPENVLYEIFTSPDTKPIVCFQATSTKEPSSLAGCPEDWANSQKLGVASNDSSGSVDQSGRCRQ